MNGNYNFYLYQDKRPELGDAVWLWVAPDWVPACLVDDPFQRARPPGERRSWNLLNANMRHAQPDDLWAYMERPADPGEAGL